MTRVAADNWARRRSALNHDWLKNQYLIKINAGLNLLEDRIEDPVLERDLVADLTSQWEIHHQQLLELVNDFESDMSPANLFDSLPLADCSEDSKQWLRALAHLLWTAREPVNEWLEQAREAVDAASKAFENLESALRAHCLDTKSARALGAFQLQFKTFRDRCQVLADALSKLPNSVRVA